MNSTIDYGDTVEVSEPKHEDSTHEHEFIGTVIGKSEWGTGNLVEDQDGEVFEVAEDEVTKVE